jgi:enoyl-CoA hydratase/carnithine racemase
MPLERVPHFVRHIRGLMDDVEAMPQPTVAVINGFCFGGGLELALACDLRVAAPHAELGLTETSLAILPGAGGTQRLPRLIGKSRAKDLILTARKLGAAEAERIGLVNRRRAGGQAAARPRSSSRSAIAANGPVAVRAAKDAIDGGLELAAGAGSSTRRAATSGCSARRTGSKRSRRSRRSASRATRASRRIPRGSLRLRPSLAPSFSRRAGRR